MLRVIPILAGVAFVTVDGIVNRHNECKKYCPAFNTTDCWDKGGLVIPDKHCLECVLPPTPIEKQCQDFCDRGLCQKIDENSCIRQGGEIMPAFPCACCQECYLAPITAGPRESCEDFCARVECQAVDVETCIQNGGEIGPQGPCGCCTQCEPIPVTTPENVGCDRVCNYAICQPVDEEACIQSGGWVSSSGGGYCGCCPHCSRETTTSLDCHEICAEASCPPLDTEACCQNGGGIGPSDYCGCCQMCYPHSRYPVDKRNGFNGGCIEYCNLIEECQKVDEEECIKNGGHISLSDPCGCCKECVPNCRDVCANVSCPVVDEEACCLSGGIITSTHDHFCKCCEECIQPNSIFIDIFKCDDCALKRPCCRPVDEEVCMKSGGRFSPARGCQCCPECYPATADTCYGYCNNVTCPCVNEDIGTQYGAQVVYSEPCGCCKQICFPE